LKRFSFRFKSVLDVKNIKEELKQKEFSAVERLLREEEGLLRHFLSEQEMLQNSLSSELSKKISGVELAFHHEYGLALTKAIKNQEEKLQILRKSLDEKRNELIEATKEKKVIENIKKRDIKEYRSSLAREEQNFLDDITATHYGKFSNASHQK